MSQRVLALSGIVLLSAAVACDTEPDVDQSWSPAQTETLLERLLEQGYRHDEIEAAPDGSLIVQDDTRYTPDPGTSEDVRFRQWHTPNLVGGSVNRIRIFFTSELQSMNFQRLLGFAVDAWNNIDNNQMWTMQFQFEAIYDRGPTNADAPYIMISVDPAVTGDLQAIADTPSGGMPGARIRLNPTFAAKVEDGGLGRFVMRTLMHEVGHTVGLRHTDWQDRHSCSSPQPESQDGAVHIDNTVNGDASDEDRFSIMNACWRDPGSGCIPAWTDDDIEAVRALYGR